ncbi:MAG: hypothetical protein J7K33_01120 [Candidatus Marinimicrobia bacterium]|nr:hypothetical protein [Candidatus Neomarinimicrobiota bacterium]
MTENEEINLELLELEEKEVELMDIMVDPNNPRLLELGFDVVPDERICEDSVQRETIDNMKKIGLKDITEKVKKFGFLTVDKVVVRPLTDNKYVVIEGNRRISALKELYEDHKRGRISLNESVLKSITSLKVLVYTGTNKDVVWLLQGIRHIKGVKEWGPLQQGRFLSEMQERRGLRAADLAKMTGIGRNTVTRLIRSYKAWEQAKTDEDHGDKINADHFSLFSEAVFRKPILKSWLGWDDDTKRFNNEENLKKLLGWYLGEDGINNGEPRLPRVNPDIRDIFSQLLLGENRELYEKFENEEISIEEVRRQMEEAKFKKSAQREKIDLDSKLSELETMATTIQTLPIPKILEEETKIEHFIERLENIENLARTQKEVINTMRVQRSG